MRRLLFAMLLATWVVPGLPVGVAVTSYEPAPCNAPPRCSSVSEFQQNPYNQNPMDCGNSHVLSCCTAYHVGNSAVDDLRVTMPPSYCYLSCPAPSEGQRWIVMHAYGDSGKTVLGTINCAEDHGGEYACVGIDGSCWSSHQVPWQDHVAACKLSWGNYAVCWVQDTVPSNPAPGAAS